MTRQQHYLSQALQHLNALKAEETGDLPEKDRQAIQARNKAYGNLCHNLPILIRINGLCQTLAFIEEKCAIGEKPSAQKRIRGEAHQALRRHIAATLEVDETDKPLLDTVREAPLTDYQRHTRTLLAAWVYYKRFAVSILNVEPSTDATSTREEV